jgi:hypothetical protein
LDPLRRGAGRFKHPLGVGFPHVAAADYVARRRAGIQPHVRKAIAARALWHDAVRAIVPGGAAAGREVLVDIRFCCGEDSRNFNTS